jgi:hypothetical protein
LSRSIDIATSGQFDRELDRSIASSIDRELDRQSSDDVARARPRGDGISGRRRWWSLPASVRDDTGRRRSTARIDTDERPNAGVFNDDAHHARARSTTTTTMMMATAMRAPWRATVRALGAGRGARGGAMGAARRVVRGTRDAMR